MISTIFTSSTTHTLLLKYDRRPEILLLQRRTAVRRHGHHGVHQRRTQHLVQSRHTPRNELPCFHRLLLRRRRLPPPSGTLLLHQATVTVNVFEFYFYFCFFFTVNRSRVLPPVNFSIVSKIGLLGIIGCTSQIMGYTGIIYSSPTLASAISNLVPAFTFILAVIFRMETLSFSKKSTRAKFLGTIVSVTGAFVVTLYKGPKLIWSLSPSSSSSLSFSVSLGSSQARWTLGGLLLTSEYILVPLWYIVQTQIMKEYPAELTVVFFYNLIVSFLAAIVGAFTEPDPNAWRIKPDVALVSILCSGILGSCLNNSVHTWALRLKGPLFVAMFKPLSIAIAVAMGVMFLGDELYLGSVIGATIISIGFYTVMWGKAKEDVIKDEFVNLESSSTSRPPLLQYYKDEDMESR